MIITESLDFSIILNLIKFLYEYNPFYIQYLTTRKQLKVNPSQLQIVLNLQMHLMIKIRVDRYRENLFIINKIAAIILYKAEVVLHRDIIFIEQTKDNILQTFFNIHIYHAVYILFIYPLIFPFNDHRYH